ncbi:hypothetical protein [Streptomyces violaceorubidus]|uniref:Uncharacterized protein n=1 Tax=Streptomyces violaceorubidus TaxID=284042 RepID=A0ABV1T2S9_9ACTN
MSDRLNQTQRHRPAGPAPTPSRPQPHQQPPLASLQGAVAAAGNRAVASAIQSGTGSAIQRAVRTAVQPGKGTAVQPATGTAVQPGNGTALQRETGTAVQRAALTAQPSEVAGRERAASSSTHDLEITAVTEPEQPGGRTRQGEDAATERQAAVDEVAEQKANVATASLARADAEADVWRSSGAAVEARRKAREARGRAEKLTGDAETAERDRTASLGAARTHTETAGRETKEQRAAEGRARTHQETERGKRAAANEAREEEQEYTRQADAAEQERKAAAARVTEFINKAEEARRKQKAAEDRVAELTKKAQEAAEKQKAAEAAAREKAAAEDGAVERAAKAQADAEAEDKVAEGVRKWADAAADALKRAADSEREAREHEGEADAADTSRNGAEREVEDWTDTRDTAREQATAARELAARRDKEADAAAKEHAKARSEAAEHEKAAAQAQRQADEARAAAGTHAETATRLRGQAATARAAEREHAGTAADAQRGAAGAARRQLEQGAAQSAATTALTAAKEAEEAEKKAAEAAEKKAAEDAAKDTGEAAERPDGADSSGGLLRNGAGRAAKSVGNAAKKVAAKVKPWVDPGDTAILRGSAPVGGALRADASKAGDTGQLHGTVLQQNAENPVNLISDATGAVNDVAALKDAAGKRHESGPASHAHRKNWKGKPLGLTTNSLMTVNDAVKITDNSIRTAKDAAGVAALGDAGGALTMSFSAVIAARDVKVIKDTHARRKELKDHFQGVAAKRDRKLQDVLDELGTATADLARASTALTAAPAGADAEALQAVEDERRHIDGLRTELLEHLASAREYAVDKKKRKLGHRVANLGGNVARTAAGALAIAAASGAVSGPVGPAVAGGLTAALLGGLAVKKGVKKAHKRHTSVRHPEKYARTTRAQEGTEEPEAPTMSKDGKGGRKRDAWKEAFMVTHSIKQGKRQLRAQEIYALAAGPAVPASKNVPNDIRDDARDFLKALKCGPDKHNQSDKEWEDSLNDPEQQTAWEEAIAKQLASV